MSLLWDMSFLVSIKLRGCDDFTEFAVETTKYGVELLKTVAEESKKASEYSCMPTMEIVGVRDLRVKEPCK
jgi:hypothetical protein